MGKQLVLAEKPSVARDIARVIGANRKGNGFIEGDRYVVTWALGTLSPSPTPIFTTTNIRRGGLRICRCCPKK